MGAVPLMAANAGDERKRRGSTRLAHELRGRDGGHTRDRRQARAREADERADTSFERQALGVELIGPDQLGTSELGTGAALAFELSRDLVPMA
jgi:hypothetical protein